MSDFPELAIHGSGSAPLDGRFPDQYRQGHSSRQVPYHCPYCADEDLRPHELARGAWHCRACLRIFSVAFLGLEPISQPPAHHWDPTPTDHTGDTR